MIIAQTVIHFAAGKKYEKYLKIIAGVIVLLLFITPFVSSREEITASWQAQMAEITERLEQLEVTGPDGTMAGIPFGAENVQETALRKIEEQVRDRLNELTADTGSRVTGVKIDLEESADESWVFSRVRIMMQDTEITEDGADISKTGADGPGRDRDAPVSDVDVSDGNAVQRIVIDEIRIGGETGAASGTEVEQEREGTLGTRAEQGREGKPETGAEREREGKPETEEEQQMKADQGAETGGGTVSEAEIQEYRRIFAQTLGIAEDRVEVEYRGGWQ